ncbi:MAG: hypothetical protein LBT47_13180 [Deltaproteobacteria bacterium]|jgi:hypothetical protein|nr:hypothetical protein [Deltaproteobacteria bacterium]
MFRKLFLKLKVSERAEIYGLLDFFIAAVGLGVELMVFEFLAFSPGRWLLGKLGADVVSIEPHSSGLLTSALALGPYCLILLIAVGFSRVIRSSLQNGFGLDPRPLKVRAVNLTLSGLVFLAYVWTASWVVFQAVLTSNLILWSVVFLGCLWLYVLGSFFLKRLVWQNSLRDIKPEEVPAGMSPFLESWQKNQKVAGGIKVSGLFQPGLTMPSYLGPNVVISDKALAAFTPDALKSGIIMAFMSQMLSLERNYLIIRLAAIALAVPGAIIILHSLGFFLGFPLSIEPWLMPLIWLAAWFAFQVSRLLEFGLKRFLCYKLNAAAATVTSSVFSIITAIGTMVRYNQIPWHSPWWRRVFTDWPSPESQVAKLEAMAKDRLPVQPPPAASGSAASPSPDSDQGAPVNRESH